MSRLDTPVIAGLLRQTLAQGQQPYVTITSNSMAPLLRRGDQVQIEAISWESLRPGDVVLVEAAVDLLTHRYWAFVHGKGTVYLRLRGDRPLDFDALLPANKLIGRAKLRRRQGRLLNLQHGGGEWLNAHLARISRGETHLFAAIERRPPPLYVRAIRRIFYIWAKILTVTVALIASSTVANRQVNYE